MKRNVLITAVIAVLLAGGVLAYAALRDDDDGLSMGSMGGSADNGATVPPVKGYLEGQEIHFIHTEASEPGIAQMLTGMMDSPVFTVESLAQAPESARANVYVFTNGIKGDGPLGFQPDVFDSPPLTPSYSPLRTVNLVTWTNERSVRELKAAAEVKDAEAKGELAIERPGVVVNMPLLTWPGGQR
ncbi:MAG: hypothetical protein AB7R89_01505 [Dehalococcoidia bacterium]